MYSLIKLWVIHSNAKNKSLNGSIHSPFYFMPIRTYPVFYKLLKHMFIFIFLLVLYLLKKTIPRSETITEVLIGISGLFLSVL